jgi:D-glycero-alpha-D-manno-heptose 1-phosphate guanylyltransferase
VPALAGHLSHTTAAVLAGGFGTRLRTVMADRPKVLAPVGGRPFLARLLDQLRFAEIASVVLCTGHLGEQVESAFGGAYRGMRLTYSRERTPLGTGGALRAAVEGLDSDPVLVLNGDSYCQTDLEDFFRAHASRGAGASLVVTRVPDVSRFGNVAMDADRTVLRFEEKAAVSGEGWINAGIYLVSRRLLEEIPTGRAVSLENEMFPRWLNAPLCAYCSEGPFLDIGTPGSYAAAERFFA